MAIKKDPKSGKWIAQVGSGKQGTRRKRGFRYKQDAEAWIREQENAILRMKMAPKFEPKMPIKNLLSLYLESLQETSIKHRDDIRNSVIDISAYCDFWVIGDVEALPVERYKNSKVPSRKEAFCNEKFISNRTKNKKIKQFKAMMEFGLRNGFLLENPLFEFKLAKVRGTERRALAKDECVELLRAAKEYSSTTWHPVIYTMLNTGMRKAELVTLEWDDLDFPRRQIYLKDKPHIMINNEQFRCKWGSSRVLPMKKSLKELLGSLPKTTNLVFPSEKGGLLLNNWNHRFARAVKDADIRNRQEVTAHVLRHTFISQLLAYGKVDIKTVSVLAGHKDLQTTQIYVHLLGGSEEHLKAIETLPDY